MASRKWVYSSAYKIALSGLVAARKKSGLTQRELARKLGKPPSWVAKIERVERRVDVVEFAAIARALGESEVKLFHDFVACLPKRLEI
jgi:transcriptional regulator with XRE-family HTH domain